MRHFTPSLHTRISLVLTALACILVLALGGLWLKQNRTSIHEEVEAASRVAEQWLTAVSREAKAHPQTWGDTRLLEHIQSAGRIRANALVVVDSRSGSQRYLSPQTAYKAGRAAPDWFVAMIEPHFSARRIDAGALTLILHPDASRATLDAWDDLCLMAGWAVILLIALFLAARRALDHALRPLGLVMAALDRTGHGRFDTRLPVFPVPELGRLAGAFNGMADRLAEAVNENVRLETEHELADRVQLQVEAERRDIARELHDELAQGITAVRALAGAIAQRTGDQPALQGHAQHIVEATSQMQDGVRNILRQLRPHAGIEPLGVDEILRRHLALWQQHYPDITLGIDLDPGSAPVSETLAQTLLRIIQEGLTNVARHAAASRVDVVLRPLGDGAERWLELCLSDNGRGLQTDAGFAGCGLGLTGMRERVADLAGELHFDSVAGGGTRLCVRLPARAYVAEKEIS
jgi:two-component system sensor histidine kinase UhpB